MYDRMQTLTTDERQRLHDASMAVLSRTGVAFYEAEALDLFKHRGFAVDGKVVRFTENQVQAALSTAPARFPLHARDPAKTLWIGEDDWVYAPTYGAPFMVEADGSRRPGTMQDYDTVCKLVQSSVHIQSNGFKHVEPQDVPTNTAYLDMLLSNILLCDKPFMGSTDTRQATRDSLAMAARVFGGEEALRDKPVMVSLVNALSPLQYAEEMAGAILELARLRQPIIIANMIMGGASGPVGIPELLVLMNAEILAGIVLAQLAGPGTPVIYGTTSCPINMRTGAATVGTPETALISAMATQMARHYNLPCRTGGSLTDSCLPDAQALAEGTLTLSTAVRCGANFILHSCGMMGGYIGNSLEKWLIDEEVCGMVRRMMTPLEIAPEGIDTGLIERVGIGGNYLMQPETFSQCRTAFFPYGLLCKEDRQGTADAGLATITQTAAEALTERLSTYEKPDIDPGLETDLAQFVQDRRGQA